MRHPSLTASVGLSLALHLAAAALIQPPAKLRTAPAPETVVVILEELRLPPAAELPLPAMKPAARPAMAPTPKAPPTATSPKEIQPDLAATTPAADALPAQPLQSPTPGPSPVTQKQQFLAAKPAAVDLPTAQVSASRQPPAAAKGNPQVKAAPVPVEKARQHYLKEHFAYIRKLVAQSVVYPASARRMNWGGKAVLAFTLTEEGGAEGIRVVESSGHLLLDRSALEAVRTAAPFPKPPARAEIFLPITFQMQQ